MKKISLATELNEVTEFWTHREIGIINDISVKVVKLEGEFVWHKHDHEDEMFFVVNGNLEIHFEDEVVMLNKDECIIIPKGKVHKPVAPEEVHIMLIEPTDTAQYGDES